MDKLMQVRPSDQSAYLPSVDGLRAPAFLAVFYYHTPYQEGSWLAEHLQVYCWAGVDLFFTISSFLFFHLLSAENVNHGKINILFFYVRRMLRIYPLMVAFPIVMMVSYGVYDKTALARLLSLALMSDNFAAWIKGFNDAIPYSAHLWTLSFEFQIYLIVPFLFSIFLRIGRQKFLYLLAGFWVFSVLLRSAFFALDSPHPIIWVTPFLRMDSFLAGIIICICRPKWPASFSFIGALLLLAVFLNSPMPWQTSSANIVQYSILAFAWALLLDSAIRLRILRFFLCTRFIAYIGSISFGLYVFHYWCIALARQILDLMAINPSDLAGVVALSLPLTIAFAVLSARFFEKPFLRIKRKFTALEGRPLTF